MILAIDAEEMTEKIRSHRGDLETLRLAILEDRSDPEDPRAFLHACVLGWLDLAITSNRSIAGVIARAKLQAIPEEEPRHA